MRDTSRRSPQLDNTDPFPAKDPALFAKPVLHSRLAIIENPPRVELAFTLSLSLSLFFFLLASKQPDFFDSR